MFSVFVRLRMCYGISVNHIYELYSRSRFRMPQIRIGPEYESGGCGRHTCERGSIAVDGRAGGDDGLLLFASLLELFRINLTGDFLPFD